MASELRFAECLGEEARREVNEGMRGKECQRIERGEKSEREMRKMRRMGEFGWGTLLWRVRSAGRAHQAADGEDGRV